MAQPDPSHHSNHHHHGDSCCQQSTAPRSVYQTLDEMDFERGLWSAAVDGEVDRVRKFLDKGEDPNTMDKSGFAPLHYACRNGHKEITSMLLQKGANPNVQTRSGGATPLHRAAYAGHIDIIECLLSHGATPSLCDEDGKSPLHKAAERGHTNICKRLLEADPSILHIKDKRNNLPVFYVSVSNKELQTILHHDASGT
ncbi:uncharacterized protein [Amphiura filiformis]|uniref:uncharacterized protein n=1 Tax=Amphiura filiformis TaxID=82378 RepID=UPI003B22420B